MDAKDWNRILAENGNVFTIATDEEKNETFHGHLPMKFVFQGVSLLIHTTIVAAISRPDTFKDGLIWLC